jgi:predicted RNA-binding protein with PUA-like domain
MQILELTMKYWLMKSEPSVFGIEDLKNRPDATEPWDGVRNYQARNYMRDDMKCGDLAFFYHSNCKVPGIVGIVEIVREAYPDNSAFNPESSYFDPKSRHDQPRWFMVDVRFKRQFSRTISLNELKECAELQEMTLLRRGNRLSIMPVTKQQWRYILSMLS